MLNEWGILLGQLNINFIKFFELIIIYSIIYKPTLFEIYLVNLKDLIFMLVQMQKLINYIFLKKNKPSLNMCKLLMILNLF